MVNPSSWGRQVAQAEVDARAWHPNDPVAQRRHREKRLGIVTRERLDDEREEVQRALQSMARRRVWYERRRKFLRWITLGRVNKPALD